MTDQTAEQKILNLTIGEYESIQPIVTVRHAGQDVVFCTPNRTTFWRAKTLLTKEPETIDWIASFARGEVLVDVGANVGMYSIWAAKTREVRVFAFEPESQNYALLNRNIFVNRVSHLASAFCVALSDETRFDRLHLSAFDIGGSCHSFKEPVDFGLRPANFQQSQGCFSTTLDALVEEGVLPPPHHIKIDVDGFEHKVLAGSANVLRNASLRSVLVEINTNLREHLAIVDGLTALDFQYSREEVEKHTVREGPFAGLANFVFRRAGGFNPPVHTDIRPLRA